MSGTRLRVNNYPVKDKSQFIGIEVLLEDGRSEMVGQVRPDLDPVRFVKRLNLCHPIYNRDLHLRPSISHLISALILLDRSVKKLLENIHQGALRGTVQHSAVCGKHRPWDYRELMHPNCLFDVNLRAVLADDHHPREKRPVFL